MGISSKELKGIPSNDMEINNSDKLKFENQGTLSYRPNQFAESWIDKIPAAYDENAFPQ